MNDTDNDGPIHVIMRPPIGFGCTHCGDEFLFDNRSVPISIVIGAGEAFMRDHAACEPSESGARRYKFTTPDEWFASWDTGLASLTIYAHFKGLTLVEVYGRNLGNRDGRPHVPDIEGSMRKCHRLLAVAPDWRARISELGERFPEWRPYTDRWDEHEAAWRANPDGPCQDKMLCSLGGPDSRKP